MNPQQLYDVLMIATTAMSYPDDLTPAQQAIYDQKIVSVAAVMNVDISAFPDSWSAANHLIDLLYNDETLFN